VGLARSRWPDPAHVDLAHRLDRDTSGCLVLTKDVAANAFLKAAFKHGEADKEYAAFVRGHLDWDHLIVDAPIAEANGPIRIQRAVREDGLPARTEVWVVDRTTTPGPPMTRVRIRLYTGRTHQIRVHLAHVAGGLVGDRMYGVPAEVFLNYWEQGDIDDAGIEAAGAPRHALHAARVAFPHPDGGTIEVTAPLAADMVRWWADPTVLPFDRAP
jgi:23S rRNA pseudouridine1911/1915/1917 synthase